MPEPRGRLDQQRHQPDVGAGLGLRHDDGTLVAAQPRREQGRDGGGRDDEAGRLDPPARAGAYDPRAVVGPRDPHDPLPEAHGRVDGAGLVDPRGVDPRLGARRDLAREGLDERVDAAVDAAHG
jgi:hypothetical protein